jgi:Protein of unknown function (DUF2009)
MTGAPETTTKTATTPAERLTAMLAAAANPPDGEQLDLDDAELAAAAAEDDARRAEFDRILATSSADWQREADPGKLRDALVRILAEIRGPALDTVGAQPRPSASGSAATDAAGPSKAPLPGDTPLHADQAHRTQQHADSQAAAAGRTNGAAGQRNDDDVDDDDAMLDDDDMSGTPLEHGRGQHAKLNPTANAPMASRDSFGERAKYIPMRLTPEDRKFLRLLEGALNVSQYTDVVDVISYSRLKAKERIHSQIVDLCSVLSGLYVACDYVAGQELVANRDFAANDKFFQHVFEVGRRHKISNPEKMRSTYGKLVFLLQDSANDEIAQMLDFSCLKPLLTVRAFLEERDAAVLLDDSLIEAATQEINANGKSRPLIQRQIKQKERAVENLARKYQNSLASDEDIRRCLYSISDNNAYLRCNRDPCDDLLSLLVQYFGPDAISKRKDRSLAIRAGYQGARLTHDHHRQYQYCLQSLSLWSEICHNMYKVGRYTFF